MKITLVQSLMRERITSQDIITRIRWKRIFLARFFWTGRKITAVSKPKLSAVLRWDKVRFCQVKTSLTSDSLSFT